MCPHNMSRCKDNGKGSTHTRKKKAKKIGLGRKMPTTGRSFIKQIGWNDRPTKRTLTNSTENCFSSRFEVDTKFHTRDAAKAHRGASFFFSLFSSCSFLYLSFLIIFFPKLLRTANKEWPKCRRSAGGNYFEIPIFLILHNKPSPLQIRCNGAVLWWQH